MVTLCRQPIITFPISYSPFLFTDVKKPAFLLLAPFQNAFRMFVVLSQVKKELSGIQNNSILCKSILLESSQISSITKVRILKMVKENLCGLNQFSSLEKCSSRKQGFLQIAFLLLELLLNANYTKLKTILATIDEGKNILCM